MKTKKQIQDDKEAAKEMEQPKRKESAYLICGLVSAAIAIYTLIALVSYVFTWQQDQSLNTGDTILSLDVEVENGGGVIGFVWADFLVSKLFGIGAFIIPFFFLGVALFCLKIKHVKLLKLFFIVLFGCIILSILCSFIFSFTEVDRMFGTGAGGSYGHYINEWLKTMIGAPGTAAILIIAVIGWLTVVNVNIARGLGNGISKVGGKVVNSVSHEGEHAAEQVDNEANAEEPKESAALMEPAVTEDEPETAEKVEEEPAATEEEPLEVGQTFDPRLELSYYKAPTFDLLESYTDKRYEVSREELESTNSRIVSALLNYKIEVEGITSSVGPTVTLYKVVPKAGVRVAQIKRLEQDIQRLLSAKGVRVVTIPGSDFVGIEVANEKPSVVPLKSCLEYLQSRINDPSSKESKYELPIAIGKTIANEVFTFDLAKCPHLLMAGATGQGKSVGINALISSILYTKHPSEVKFVLVDPKKVELSSYSPLANHFLACLPGEEDPVITDTKKVVNTLRSLCVEMDRRYDLLKIAGVRNIKEYNEKFLAKKLVPSPQAQHEYLPYIVLVIDEYSDLMMTAGKDIEVPLTRLAQLARAIGIHLVIATQRPTASVVTGNIKANFPTRIAFSVRSSIDSRTILDEVGANQLIGRGDMLYATGSELIRVQCALIETDEVNNVVSYITAQQGYGQPKYLPEVPLEEGEADLGGGGRADSDSDDPFEERKGSGKPSRGGVDPSVPLGEANLRNRDEYFDQAAELIVAAGGGSASFIQRKMNLGYNRSSRIIDQLEQAGIVGPADGGKPREALVSDLAALDDVLKSLKEEYGG